MKKCSSFKQSRKLVVIVVYLFFLKEYKKLVCGVILYHKFTGKYFRYLQLIIFELYEGEVLGDKENLLKNAYLSLRMCSKYNMLYMVGIIKEQEIQI